MKVAKDFRVYYAKAQGKTPGDYTMDHTAASYVFDPQGKLGSLHATGRASKRGFTI